MGIRLHSQAMSESSSSPTASLAAPKRACDACHRRKIKCIGDGSMPCRNCASAGLRCTFNAVPQKKGPKGSRAKVISELRETQQRKSLPSSQGPSDPPSPPPYMRTAGLLSSDIITACVDFFFLHMYSTQPILHRQQIQEAIMAMDESNEAYCFLCALCAYVLIQPNMALPEVTARNASQSPTMAIGLGSTLLDEANRIRRSYNYFEMPNVWSIVISFFFFGSYFGLDQQSIAWFHLREATTLAITIGMDQEETYTVGDPMVAVRKRRLFWLLFVTERAYALQRHRPLTLHATIRLPTADEDPNETVELLGFCHLINLFKPFDNTFVGLWNKTTQGCTNTWMAKLQAQLMEVLPAYLHSTETQAVDIHTSRQWLRTMVWQLSISQGFLSSAASENAMSFRYPIEISRDMISAMHQFSQQAMEVHGIGLVEKIFDIACALADVMAIVPMDSNTSESGPRDYLREMISLLSRLRGGQQRFLPLLLSKVNETIPDMTHSVTPNMSSMSLVDERREVQYPSSRSNSSQSTTPPSFSSPSGSTTHPVFSDDTTGTAKYPMAASFSSSAGFAAINPTTSFPGQEQHFSYGSGQHIFPDVSDF